MSYADIHTIPVDSPVPDDQATLALAYLARHDALDLAEVLGLVKG